MSHPNSAQVDEGQALSESVSDAATSSRHICIKRFCLFSAAKRSCVSTIAWSCMGLTNGCFFYSATNNASSVDPLRWVQFPFSFTQVQNVSKILNLNCFNRCIWENQDQIRTKLQTGNRVRNTCNYSLDGRCYADIAEQVHSDIMTHEKTRFKINYSSRVILSIVDTDQICYFYGSLGNARILDFAVLISNQDDLRKFWENICDFDMREKSSDPTPNMFWSLLSIACPSLTRPWRDVFVVCCSLCWSERGGQPASFSLHSPLSSRKNSQQTGDDRDNSWQQRC